MGQGPQQEDVRLLFPPQAKNIHRRKRGQKREQWVRSDSGFIYFGYSEPAFRPDWLPPTMRIEPVTIPREGLSLAEAPNHTG
jgi:hypothetical protein